MNWLSFIHIQNYCFIHINKIAVVE